MDGAPAGKHSQVPNRMFHRVTANGLASGNNSQVMLANLISKKSPRSCFCRYIPAMIDHEDFSVVVKNRASPPKPWRWEIYRAGRTSPIEHSQVYFESMSEASRAGKAALKLMLSECQN